MYVRLGFAVAAHLDTEILLVDEVLAVGDDEFQRKCIGKMRDVDGRGGPHGRVRQPQPRVGRAAVRPRAPDRGRRGGAEGPVAAVTAGYLSSVDPAQHGGVIQIPEKAPRIGTGDGQVPQRGLLDPDDGQPTGSLLLNQPLIVETTLEVFETIEEAVLEIGITTPTACGS